MKLKMSNNVAFETKNRKAAEQFYENVLGLTPTERKEFYTEYGNEQIKFYVVDEKKCPGLMLDFVADNQAQAIEHLKKNGCEVLQWDGQGDCFMKDPFGLMFNVGQK